MSRNEFEFAYRQSSIAGASTIAIVIALYDRLSRDFRDAAAAMRSNNIEQRCTALNHATVILGHLENWIDHVNGGELAANLATLYSYLRAKMLEASIQQSPSLLEAQIELISQVRSAWQQKDSIDQRISAVPAGMPYAVPVEPVSFSRSA